jgi:hypothetical protein
MGFMLLASQPEGIWSASARWGGAPKIAARRGAQNEICQQILVVGEFIFSPGEIIKILLWVEYHEGAWM